MPTHVLARELLNRHGDGLLRWALAEATVEHHLRDEGELPESYIQWCREKVYDALWDAEWDVIVPYIEHWGDHLRAAADRRLEDEVAG